MGKTFIRVPRTTSMFVTALGRILRERFGLQITQHEHWTFEHVGEWTVCGSPGECYRHDTSRKFLDEEGEVSPLSIEEYFYDCYEYTLNAYLGVGQAKVRGKQVELRVRIEQSHSDALGELFTMRVWVQDHEGTVTKGEFGLFENGAPYPTDKSMPDLPPDRIAFWRRAEDEVTAA